jgi:hypothetical protein
MKSAPTSAVLLSRQPLRPCGTTPWVVKAAEAVRRVEQNGHRLLASTGMQTWEMLVYLAKIRNVDQTILVPATEDSDFQRQKDSLLHDFELPPDATAFEKVSIPDANKSRKSLLLERDRQIVRKADILLPVSIRPGGHMDALIKERLDQGRCRVINDFRIDHDNRPKSISYGIETEIANPEIATVGNQYLIHWTRATNGPWPGEKKLHYFSDVANSESYPRDGFRTLRNILKTGGIAASSMHMPKGVSTVSFSGLSPEKAAPLMKWRARYRIMSFEPYGVGIERTAAGKLGVLPVEYHPSGAPPPGVPPWLLQSEGAKTDWKREEEYRYPADFPLSSIDRPKIACFCRRREEAEQIRREFGVKTLWFQD